MTQAQPLIQTLPMTLGAPMSDDPSNPTAIEIPLQIELPNGQTLFAAVALGGLPFDGQRQIAERITAAWNAFTGVTTEEIKAPVKCLLQIAEPAAQGLDAREFPPMTPELASILGLMCFQCISFAQALRAGGHQIASRAEDEQAAVLHWMLGHYFRHGDDWRTVAAEDMKRMEAEALAAQAKQGGAA